MWRVAWVAARGVGIQCSSPNNRLSRRSISFNSLSISAMFCSKRFCVSRTTAKS
jgi:hypothetical protein